MNFRQESFPVLNSSSFFPGDSAKDGSCTYLDWRSPRQLPGTLPTAASDLCLSDQTSAYRLSRLLSFRVSRLGVLGSESPTTHSRVADESHAGYFTKFNQSGTAGVLYIKLLPAQGGPPFATKPAHAAFFFIYGPLWGLNPFRLNATFPCC